MPIHLVPRDTKIPFMRFSRMAIIASCAALLASALLFLTIGLNLGIDFKGGTLIEVRAVDTEQADLSGIRSKISALGLGDIEIQGFGEPTDALIRIEAQSGGEDAQQIAIEKVQETLGFDAYDYRRVEVVGPKISSELAKTGTIAVIVTLIGVLLYIWFRFEWQFAIGAIAALTHDVILTIGFFVVVQLEFNLSSIAAILTIVGYSLNDTVVVYDRIREILRKYKQRMIEDLIDLAVNQTLSRTLLTSVTTLLALGALFFFGGAVIRSFVAAMIWGVVIGTYSSIFIAAPILVWFKLRPATVAPPENAAKA
jgi:preprotein translocase SecF subunit